MTLDPSGLSVCDINFTNSYDTKILLHFPKEFRSLCSSLHSCELSHLPHSAWVVPLQSQKTATWSPRLHVTVPQLWFCSFIRSTKHALHQGWLFKSSNTDLQHWKKPTWISGQFLNLLAIKFLFLVILLKYCNNCHGNFSKKLLNPELKIPYHRLYYSPT